MRYLNMLISYGAFPPITKSTRVTKNSSSIIDHISNDIKHPIFLELLKHAMFVIITQSFAK